MVDVSGDKIWVEILGFLLGNKDEIKGRKRFVVLLFFIKGYCININCLLFFKFVYFIRKLK